MKLNLIINFAFCIVNCALLCSCKAQKPVATTHTERIEERVMPIPVAADTIEITLPHTENNWLTERTDNTEDAVATPAEDRFISDFKQSEKSKFRELRGFRERTNNSVREKESSVSEKNNSVRNTNSAGVKSVQIRRATSCVARERIEEKEKVKSEQSVLSVGDEKSCSEKKSVHSVSSVSEKNNSVRIKSTRGINISRYETDTTSTLRITLRPDTVFVPYINHIRSDTIVVPDRICQQKLNHSNMTNLFLILILIMIIIIFLKNRMTR